jgi:hypothetical protein
LTLVGPVASTSGGVGLNGFGMSSELHAVSSAAVAIDPASTANRDPSGSMTKGLAMGMTITS